MKDIVTIFCFISVFLLITGLLYCFLLRNKNYEKRLNYYLDINEKYKKSTNPKINDDAGNNVLKSGNELIRKGIKKQISGGKQQKLNEMFISAGVNLKPEEFIMLRIFLAVLVGGIFYLIFSNILILIIGAIIGYFIPKLWLKNKRKKRIRKFNDGLPDMINTMIGSLKAGYSLGQAIKTVSEESPSPIKEEIGILIKELSYGVTMEEGLNNLNARMPSIDLEILIRAILIQREVGGNLSEILEIIVNTIRQRKKIEREVRTFTAQGRLSGKIIGCLPIALGLILFLFDKQYITDFVGNIIGKIAIGIGILFAILGFIIINRITKIEV